MKNDYCFIIFVNIDILYLYNKLIDKSYALI